MQGREGGRLEKGRRKSVRVRKAGGKRQGVQEQDEKQEEQTG